MIKKDRKTIADFFDTYNVIIDTKLDSGDYELKLRHIIIKINERFDVMFFPFSYKANKGMASMLETTIVRYTDITGYARLHDIHNSYSFSINDGDDEYKLYYSKSNEIYSTLNIPSNNIFNDQFKFMLFDDIKNDIRLQKIDNLLE